MMERFQASPEFRRGRPWCVAVPWPFMPLILLSAFGVVAAAALLLDRFLPQRLPGLLIQAILQASMVATVLLMFALIPPLGRIAGKTGMRKISLSDLKFVLLGLLLIHAWNILSMPLWNLLIQTLERSLDLSFEQRQKELGICSGSSLPELLGLLALLAVLIPFVEEVVYRRLLFGVFRPLGVWPALIYTALIFAAMHGFVYGFPALLGLGIVFQWQYLRTENLWTSALTHMIFNATSVTLVSLYG